MLTYVEVQHEWLCGDVHGFVGGSGGGGQLREGMLVLPECSRVVEVICPRTQCPPVLLAIRRATYFLKNKCFFYCLTLVPFHLLSFLASETRLGYFWKFFKKWAKPGLFFVYFCHFLSTNSIIQIEKSANGVLEIWTLSRRIVGTDDTTVLWRPPYFECSWWQLFLLK